MAKRKQQHRYDLKPSPPDERDFRVGIYPGVALPAAAEIADPAPIRDQGQEGSCWGFCGTGARQDAARQRGDTTTLSPSFLYWQTRKAMGDDVDDTGSDMRTGLDTMKKVGICPEELMPYKAGDFAAVPSDEAASAAARYVIAAYLRLGSIAEIKAQIVAGNAVMLGITVYPGFEATKDGYVPMPGPREAPLGGHAIRCIGYRDDPTAPGGGWLTLANSWGEGAGDHGRYYLPYGYLDLAAGERAETLAEAWALVAP